MNNNEATVETKIDSAKERNLNSQTQVTKENVPEEVPRDGNTEIHWDKFPQDLQIAVVRYLSVKNRVMLKRVSPDFHYAVKKVPLVLDVFTITIAPDGIKYSVMNGQYINRHFGEIRSFRCYGHGDVQKPVPGEPVIPFDEAALNSMMMFLSDRDLTFRKLVIRGVVDEYGYSPRITRFLKKLDNRLKSIKTPIKVINFQLYTSVLTLEDLLCVLPHLKPRVLKSLNFLFDSEAILNLDPLENLEQFKCLRSFITNGIVNDFKILSHIDYISVDVRKLSTALVNSLINEMKKKKNFDGLVLSVNISRPELFRNSLMKSEIREKSDLFVRRFYLTEINDELVVEVNSQGVYFRTGKQFMQYEESLYLRTLPFRPLYPPASGFSVKALK